MKSAGEAAMSGEARGDVVHDATTSPDGVVTPFNLYLEHYYRGGKGSLGGTGYLNDIASYKGCNWEWKMMVLNYMQNCSVNDVLNDLKVNHKDTNYVNAPAQKSPVDSAKRLDDIFSNILSDATDANTCTDSGETTDASTTANHSNSDVKRKMGKPRRVPVEEATEQVAGQEAIDEAAGQEAIDEAAGEEVAVEEVPPQVANVPINSFSDDVKPPPTNFRYIAEALALTSKREKARKEARSVEGAVEAMNSIKEVSTADTPQAALAVGIPDNVNSCSCGYCSSFTDVVRRKLIEWRRLPDSARQVYKSLVEAASTGEIAVPSTENKDKKRKLVQVFPLSIFCSNNH